MSSFRRALALLAVLLVFVGAGVVLVARARVERARIPPTPETVTGLTPSSTPQATTTYLPFVAVEVTEEPASPTPSPTVPVPDPTVLPVEATPTGSTIYLPWISNGSSGGATEGQVAETPTAAPIPAPAAGPPTQTPVPTPTRGPIRITKLGLGVYESGGAMLPALDEARPSVILLLDPTQDFAQEVRRRFPKAFLVGRIYTADQPLDNPTQRGAAFADRVAASAVPLKGVVDAWMSYNEIGSPSDPASMVNYNLFQVAFAHRLQDTYGIPAVAGNDGPRAIPAELYPRYYADAIQTSRYFGVHIYPDPNVKSLRDPAASDQVFYYRKIHAALQAAGVKHGPFIATEIGLYNGWRGVTSDTEMGRDLVWVADQMNNDPYMLGMAVFGLFHSDRWAPFNVADSNILETMGDYNTVH